MHDSWTERGNCQVRQRSGCPSKLFELPQHPAMEGDLLSRMISPKDCATSNFTVFLLLFFQFFLGRWGPNYEVSLDALGIRRSLRRLKIISGTFNIQLATRSEAMIEIMKRFNVEICKTIAVIRTKWNIINLNFVSFMFRFILSPRKDTYLVDKEKL